MERKSYEDRLRYFGLWLSRREEGFDWII